MSLADWTCGGNVTKIKIVRTLTGAACLSLVMLALDARAERVECKANIAWEKPMKLLIEFQQGRMGAVRIRNADGTRHITWGLSSEFKRRHRGEKLIYLDRWGSQKWLLEVNSPTAGGTDLKARFSMGPSLAKVPVTCVITGEANPPVRACKASGTDLISAAKFGDLEDLERVLDCGVDVNFTDRRGCSALLYSVDDDCGTKQSLGGASSSDPYPDSVVRMLVDEGANVEARDPVTGETLLIKASRFNVEGVVKQLIGLEVDINAQDLMGNTALMAAAATGESLLVETILEGNPDRTLKNKKGETAYAIAKRFGHREILDLLMPAAKKETITGLPGGACSPTMVHLEKGKPVEIVLKATDKMLLLTAPDLGLELMSGSGESKSKVITPQNTGTFPFTCGPHGAPEKDQTKGSFMVM